MHIYRAHIITYVNKTYVTFQWEDASTHICTYNVHLQSVFSDLLVTGGGLLMYKFNQIVNKKYVIHHQHFNIQKKS